MAIAPVSNIQARPAPQAVRFGCANHGKAPAARFGSEVRPLSQPAADHAGETAVQRICRRMIEWYQNNKFIHDKLYKWINLKCPFPEHGFSSCSQYTKEAIAKHGAVKGILMGTGRILSCNPITKKFLEKGTFRWFLRA